jgi:hypothetical protein
MPKKAKAASGSELIYFIEYDLSTYFRHTINKMI